jgi:hypothetical protein
MYTQTNEKQHETNQQIINQMVHRNSDQQHINTYSIQIEPTRSRIQSIQQLQSENPYSTCSIDPIALTDPSRSTLVSNSDPDPNANHHINIYPHLSEPLLLHS